MLSLITGTQLLPYSPPIPFPIDTWRANCDPLWGTIPRYNMLIHGNVMPTNVNSAIHIQKWQRCSAMVYKYTHPRRPINRDVAPDTLLYNTSFRSRSFHICKTYQILLLIIIKRLHIHSSEYYGELFEVNQTCFLAACFDETG